MLEGKRQIWPWGVSKLIPWHSLLGNICLLLWLHPHELWTCSTCRWAGQEAPFPELTAQNKVALWLKLLWAAGALGLLLLLCQHVPCASCFSVTSPGTGWWHFGDKPPGKGGREDVMGILWALRSMVSHATVLTFLKCAPPQPCSWFPAFVTDLCSELSCIPRKSLSNLGMDNSTPEYQLHSSAPVSLMPYLFFQKTAVFRVFA